MKRTRLGPVDSDKTIHLEKIMELDNEVHEAFKMTEVSVRHSSSKLSSLGRRGSKNGKGRHPIFALTRADTE